MTTPKPSRLPFVILGLMTLACFGGPVAFGYVLRGGPNPDWPPDRPVEWATLGLVSGLVVLLMLVSFSFALRNRSEIARATARKLDEPRLEP